MKKLITDWAYIAILVGILGGLVWVLLVSILRKNQKVNSLLKADDLLGRECTVEIPFDRENRGKIRVSIKGFTMDLLAVTQEKTKFNKGEKAVILERINNNTVSVVSEKYLSNQDLD